MDIRDTIVEHIQKKNPNYKFIHYAKPWKVLYSHPDLISITLYPTFLVLQKADSLVESSELGTGPTILTTHYYEDPNFFTTLDSQLTNNPSPPALQQKHP